jgi:hypothetical protein
MAIDNDKNIKTTSLFKYHVIPINLSTELPKERQNIKQATALIIFSDSRKVNKKKAANISSYTLFLLDTKAMY